MSARRTLRGLLVLAAVATAATGVPALSATTPGGSWHDVLDTGRSGDSHEQWRYIPGSWQPGGLVAAVPELAVNLVTPVDGVDYDAQRHLVHSRTVRLLIADASVINGQTVRAQLSGFRDGHVRWIHDACLPVGAQVAIRGLRRGDQLSIRVRSDADDWPSDSLDACTGRPVGGTIDLWS